MGLFSLVANVVGVLLLAGAGGGVYLYATDFKLSATIQETRCVDGEIDVETKKLGIDHTVKKVPAEQCNRLEAGNFVEYRVRSKRTTLYEVEGGECIYDSKTGPFCGDPPTLFNS